MRLEYSTPVEAVGAILVHNVADAQGHKLLGKGHLLTSPDADRLISLGRSEVYVARLDAGDVRENEAASRIARAAAGDHLALTPASGGRVNLLATTRGVLEIADDRLLRLNSIPGVTLATLPGGRVVEPNKIAATVKTIGLALAQADVNAAEAVAGDGPIVSLFPLRAARVAVILSGSPEAEGRVRGTFVEPIRARVDELGGQVLNVDYVPEEPQSVAGAILRAAASGADCVILAGETSIMDADDIVPRGIRAAGGEVELYGAPVEPGNLLLLAYRGALPILGAPGCVKSRERNVVDLILPRLLTGRRVSRADVIALANGGLLL